MNLTDWFFTSPPLIQCLIMIILMGIHYKHEA